MKKGESNIKRYLVLSLSVVYLLIAVTYILYLPKYNLLRTANNYTRVKTHQVLNPTHKVEHSAANMIVLFHMVYKSSTETKRQALSGSLQTTLALALLISGAIGLFALLRKSDKHFKLLRYSRQYAYLSYCTLRI
jgi:uncharacterized membrane protein YkvI